MASARRALSLPVRRCVAAVLSACLGLASAAAASELQDPFLQSSYYGPTAGEHPSVASLISAADGAGDAPAPEVDITLTGYGAPRVDGYGRSPGRWGWQLLPDGIIYRSYLAGPREPRIGTTFFNNSTSLQNSESLWDGAVGGRRGLIRFGSGDPLKPEGWQLDLEGAAIVRLNIDEERDLDASDFRFGAPLTYGAGPVQYKLGYYHISSHLGDEFITRTGSNTRINYVRDAIIAGVSYNPAPAWRVYGETAYAVFTSGGAEPWEFQLGVEYAQPGVTGVCGTPFFATNAHLREELDFGGDWTTQVGWLWRGASGSMFRVGLHYVNGKSTQYQFFNTNEEQIGFGAWYDF